MGNYPDKYYDLMYFPRLGTTGTEGSIPFLQGLLLDMALDDVDDLFRDDRVDEMRSYYEDAFNEGSIEAGVNLMRFFVKMRYGSQTPGHVGENDNLKIISDKLAAIEHPIVPFYEALDDILIEGKKSAGWERMKKLAFEGNKFAATLYAFAIVNQG